MFLLHNCKLVKELTEGTELQMADILLEGNKISMILPCNASFGGEYQEMDVNGATVLPGLIDMHVHLFKGKKHAWKTDERIDVPAQWALDCLKYAQFLLDLGFTTLRDVGDEIDYPAIAVRNAINEGDFVGPRIKCAGVTISPQTAGFASHAFMNAHVNGPFEMRRVVREQFAHGADLIKLYGTGSIMVADSLQESRILEEDEVREAVAIAERKGSYCACHCHGAEAIGVMIDNGVRTIEHASFITDASCQKLNCRKDTGIVPTIACSCREMNIINGYDEAEIERYDSINQQRNACLKNAYENYDILMGWGTGFSLDSHKIVPFIEWQQRKNELGFSNIDILKQATINGAMLMGMDNEIGSIKEGKLADLIIVGGDPALDITAMYQKPVHIIKDGVLIR